MLFVADRLVIKKTINKFSLFLLRVGHFARSYLFLVGDSSAVLLEMLLQLDVSEQTEIDSG